MNLTPQQEFAASLLRKAGCPDKAIGRILGVNMSRVWRWRAANGFSASTATVGPRWEEKHPKKVRAIMSKAGLCE